MLQNTMLYYLVLVHSALKTCSPFKILFLILITSSKFQLLVPHRASPFERQFWGQPMADFVHLCRYCVMTKPAKPNQKLRDASFQFHLVIVSPYLTNGNKVNSLPLIGFECKVVKSC